LLFYLSSEIVSLFISNLFFYTFYLTSSIFYLLHSFLLLLLYPLFISNPIFYFISLLFFFIFFAFLKTYFFAFIAFLRLVPFYSSIISGLILSISTFPFSFLTGLTSSILLLNFSPFSLVCCHFLPFSYTGFFNHLEGFGPHPWG